MKVAVISDIHSNYYYLNSVFKAINQHDVDEIYCLGDMVGYYDQPNETIDFLRSNNIKCIKGNQEKYLLDEINYDISKEDIYRIKIQKKTLNSNNIKFLEGLPEFIEEKLANNLFYFTHSLPKDSLTYIRNIDQLDFLKQSKFNFYCFGHTHIPFLLYHYGVGIINPGSVGQPRDYTGKPSYAIVDLDQTMSFLIKVKVNNDKYSQKLKSINIPDYLIDILNRTK